MFISINVFFTLYSAGLLAISMSNDCFLILIVSSSIVVLKWIQDVPLASVMLLLYISGVVVEEGFTEELELLLSGDDSAGVPNE